jgi:Tfp pilus assembly protein PilF
MSIAPHERQQTDQALIILRTSVQQEREKRRAWQAWALILEQQMQREGWTQGDFDDLPIGKPE